MYLEEIIENIQLENDKFECKSKLNRDDVVGWLKTIVEEYKGENETHRPYIYSSSDHFTLVLPDLTYMDGVEDSSPRCIQML